MSRPVQRIEVYGFKSIAESKLALTNLNVLIGANGAGKSNFIGVFKLFNNLIRNNLQNFVRSEGGANDLLFLGRSVTEEITIKLSFGRNGYRCTLLPNDEDSLFFAKEIATFQGDFKKDYEEGLGSGHLESKLIGNEAKVTRYVAEAFQGWQIYHFHDTSESAKVKQTNDIEDNKFLRPDAGNLAAFLYLLKQRYSDSYLRIVDVIKLIAPFFEDFALEPSRLNPEKIRLEWIQKGSTSYFGPSQLSDGTLRMMCLATLLLQPNLPTTILIDEPELGLHPYAIEVLSSLLKTTSQRSQVIVSTQSVTLVDSLDAQDIIIVDHDNHASTFTRLKEDSLNEWLLEYSLGDLWAKNLLGARPL